ncbi:hypothetical protein [Paenibacillus pectinilyticus]|uniref:hypothetical protein n=1 Tax=Paenibacillus pectinilyticus TaxID=512399 RepID=UPI001428C034|nr:hypothetical protein [Paenibacillus pectinilyticus]
MSRVASMPDAAPMMGANLMQVTTLMSKIAPVLDATLMRDACPVLAATTMVDA